MYISTPGRIISTHSLTKRLTSGDYFKWVTLAISTHSLTKRLTNRNPDRRSIVPAKDISGISTHSLTKRLTPQQKSTDNSSDISTHSLTKRLTINSHDIFLLFYNFNSQPHEEADCSSEFSRSCNRNFNSQPHEEADVGLPKDVRDVMMFVAVIISSEYLTGPTCSW